MPNSKEKSNTKKRRRGKAEPDTKKNKKSEAELEMDKEADKLLKEMEELKNTLNNSIKRQKFVIAYLDRLLPSYEKRLEHIKSSYHDNSLSSAMIEGDPESKWAKTYENYVQYGNEDYDQVAEKYPPLDKKLQKMLKNKHLSKDAKDALTKAGLELKALYNKVLSQSPRLTEGSCNLRFNSLNESIYKTNAQCKELIQSVKQVIDETKTKIDELKNPSNQFPTINIKKQIDCNEECIRHLNQKIDEIGRKSDFYRDKDTTCYPRVQIAAIQSTRGEDYSTLKKLKEKQAEFGKQNVDLIENITALVNAKNELIALNDELFARKAALCEEEKKEETPPLKKSTQSNVTQKSDRFKIVNLFGKPHGEKEYKSKEKSSKLQLSSYLDMEKGMPELLLHPKKELSIVPAQKKPRLKSGTEKEETLHLSFYPGKKLKKLKKNAVRPPREKTSLEAMMEESARLSLHPKEELKKKADVFLPQGEVNLETIMEKSCWMEEEFRLSQQDEELSRFLMENPPFKSVVPKPKGIVLKERSKSQNKRPVVKGERTTDVPNRHDALSVGRPYYKGIPPVIKMEKKTGLPITLKKKHV